MMKLKEINKRKIENLVFLIVVLIITVVIINYVWSGDKSSSKNMTNSAGKQLAEAKITQSTTNSTTQSQIGTTNENLEQRLENILTNIEGVGDVKVFINYSESAETVAMYNENSKTSTTEETDKSGELKRLNRKILKKK